jgi:hypothetical protein
MEWFVCHRSELVGMGEKSREMAESLFDVHKVNAAMIDFIEERDA